MNPDITPENIGTVSVRHKGQYHDWHVTNIDPNEAEGTITYSLTNDQQEQIVGVVPRYGFGDSLSVVRGSLKTIILHELDHAE